MEELGKFRKHQRLILLVCIALSTMMGVAGHSENPPAGGNAGREQELKAIALAGAAAYERNRPLYTYEPRHDPRERGASDIAVTGNLLLEAYRATGDSHWRDSALIAADSLVAHADMNGDGKVGWGRYWKADAARKDPAGGHTTFAAGCTLPRNRAYDDELFDDARVVQFLLEMYQTTNDKRYLDTGRRAIEDTWDKGQEVARGQGFSYFKTIGPCDRGWRIKNIDMLMAVPVALLGKITGEERFKQRAKQLVWAEQAEIRRTVGGRPAPNLGYLAIETAEKHPTRVTAEVQSTDPSQTVTCNLRTSTGLSCAYHLGIEARGLAMAQDILGLPREAYAADVRTIMRGFEEHDDAFCTNERLANGTQRQATPCAAYYCALRQLTPSYMERCYSRAIAWGAKTPDVILGLFWGAPR